jgi:hypothetical protein
MVALVVVMGVVFALVVVVVTAVVFAAYTICLRCPPCLYFRRGWVVA